MTEDNGHAHGSIFETSSAPQRKKLTKREIQELIHSVIPKAIAALEDAIANADHPTAIRAAAEILDRAGFGRHATLAIEDRRSDVQQLSDEDLLSQFEHIRSQSIH
jgi:hypothetical protein